MQVALQGSREWRQELMRALHLLALMYQANERGGRRVQLSEFYNTPLSESIDVQDEYVLWRRLSANVRYQLL
jgi:hypothetical protein